MAAIFKVKLEDNYTDKAKKIANSASQMETAMSKVGSAAKKTRSALKSALSGKHQVKISEIGSKEAQARIRGLQGELNTISKGKYRVDVTARSKTAGLDAIKRGLDSVKSKAGTVKSSLSNFKVNTKTLVSAKKEAFQLSRELTKATGKRHRVKIAMDKPNVGGFMSGFKTKMMSGFSKLNPKNWFGGGGGGPAGAALGGGGGLVGSIVKGSLITGAIQKGFSALKGGFDATLGAGMTRLENIQASKAKLRGFGHDDKTVDTISKNAMAAVKGTAYGFGDAMTASANAVAAGVKPGKDLEKHLGIIANSAAATGADFNEMGSIFNKVKTTGYLQGDEAMQIMDRGIALLPALAKTMGTSVDEVRKKMSKGEISFEQFSEAMESATGTVASEMSNTFSGAKDNLKAALGRVGANLLGGSDNNSGIFAMLTPMIKGLTTALGPLETVAGKVGDKLGDLATGAIDKVKSGLSYLGDKFKPIGDKLSQMVEPLKGVFGSLKDSVGKIFGSGADLGGSIIDAVLTGAVNGLSTLADIVQAYVIPALQTAADFIGTYVVPAVQTAVSWIQANVIPALQQFGDFIIANVVPALQTIWDSIQANVVPALQQFGSWIMDSVVPAIQQMATWIGENVVPKLQELATWIGDNVVPKLQSLAEFIADPVIPKFVEIATLVGGAVKTAFDTVRGAVEAAKNAFDAVKGAVDSAVGAIRDIPGAVANLAGNAWNNVKQGASDLWNSITSLGKKGHATGTSYFGGGMTRVNERGEEMIQLARGDKIYPAGKTDRIIEKQINNKNQNRETKNVTISPTININGANKNEKEMAKEVNRQLRRLAVNI